MTAASCAGCTAARRLLEDARQEQHQLADRLTAEARLTVQEGRSTVFAAGLLYAAALQRDLAGPPYPTDHAPDRVCGGCGGTVWQDCATCGPGHQACTRCGWAP